MPINPGTSNNVERTRDRDLEFSKLMRPIPGIKVCDIDPTPICPNCEHPILAWEVKREFRNIYWAVCHSKYTRILALAFSIPAYFVYHQPADGKLTVTLLNADAEFPSQTYTVAEFQNWVGEQQAKHVCTSENLERQKIA
jgi:hypothetical protein